MSCQTRSPEIDKDTPNLDRWATQKAKTVLSEPMRIANDEEFKAQPKATAKELAASIISYLTREGEGVCVIPRVDESQAYQLEEELEKAGWKVKYGLCLAEGSILIDSKARFEWDAKIKQVTIRMASRLHSAPLDTFTHANFHHLLTRLNEVSPCQHQKLQCGGDSRIRLVNWSRRHPDGCFTVQEGPTAEGFTWSRVVFECLRTQPYADAMKKKDEFLALKEAINVVIFLIYENAPTASKPNEKCRARIEVWTRKPTVIDYPLDYCPWPSNDSSQSNDNPKEAGAGASEGNASVGMVEDPGAGVGNGEDDNDGAGVVGETQAKGAGPGQVHGKNKEIFESNAESNPTGDDNGSKEGVAEAELLFVSNATTKVDEATDTSIPESKTRMRGDSVLVFSEDENDRDDVQDELYLDAYDFFRICAEKQNARLTIEERAISLDLKPLQEAITAALRDERRDLKEAKPLPRNQPSLAVEKKRMPDLRVWSTMEDFVPRVSKKRKTGQEQPSN